MFLFSRASVNTLPYGIQSGLHHMAGGLEGHPYEDNICDSKYNFVGQLAPPPPPISCPSDSLQNVSGPGTTSEPGGMGWNSLNRL